MDVTKPLHGTLIIPTSDTVLHSPILYEGLHEVCVICGSMTHALEACPDSPKNVFEVFVEKFGATMLHPDSVAASPGCGSRSTTPSESWVTVSPKQSSRLPSAHRKRGIWPAPTRFTTPKVTAVFMPATTPPWYFWTSILVELKE